MADLWRKRGGYGGYLADNPIVGNDYSMTRGIAQNKTSGKKTYANKKARIGQMGQ